MAEPEAAPLLSVRDVRLRYGETPAPDPDELRPVFLRPGAEGANHVRADLATAESRTNMDVTGRTR